MFAPSVGVTHIIIIQSVVPSRNIGFLWVLSTSVYRLLRTSVHSSFYPLPWSPIFSSYFFVFLSSCFPEGSKVGQPLVSLHPLFLMCDRSILNFLFLISTFISSCPVTFHRSLLEIIFGHHILNIYLRHLFTKVCILRWISFVTSQVSHPHKSTDFTQALNILILVCFRNNLDSHTVTHINVYISIWLSQYIEQKSYFSLVKDIAINK